MTEQTGPDGSSTRTPMTQAVAVPTVAVPTAAASITRTGGYPTSAEAFAILFAVRDKLLQHLAIIDDDAAHENAAALSAAVRITYESCTRESKREAPDSRRGPSGAWMIDSR